MNKELKKLLANDLEYKEAMAEREKILKDYISICDDFIKPNRYKRLKDFLEKAKIDYVEKPLAHPLCLTYTYEGWFHNYTDLHASPEYYNHILLLKRDKTTAEAVWKAFKKYEDTKKKAHDELVNSKTKEILERLS